MSDQIKDLHFQLDDLKKIQRYMQLAKKENATETYAELNYAYK